MKRDCGEGELIVTSYSVVYCSGKADRELECNYPTKEQALELFESLVSTLPEHSNIRLYAKDKQGYANCMLYVTISINRL